jgi:hypothetical protein
LVDGPEVIEVGKSLGGGAWVIIGSKEDGVSIGDEWNRGGLAVELGDMAMVEGSKSSEHCKIGGLELTSCDGVEEKGLKKEEELPQGISGSLVRREVLGHG